MASDIPDVYVRFDGLEGECRDDQHPGDKGWIPIKGFRFSVGVKDTGDSGPTTAKLGKAKTEKERYEEMVEMEKKRQQDGAKKPAAKSSTTKEEAFDRPAVTISKSPDLMSTELLRDKCHKGQHLKEVVVEACRYGGDNQEMKIPFLRLTFGDVCVQSISIGLCDDPVPSEDLTFKYERVTLETVWTDNETGKRIAGGTQRAGWDFQHQEPLFGYSEA